MEHKKKKKIKVGTASKFVIPPAGMLSAVSARIYDMGEDSPVPQQDTPLLFTAQSTQMEEREYVETARRALRNAAVIVTTGLFLVLTVTFTLFFGGMYFHFTNLAISLIRNPPSARFSIHFQGRIIINIQICKMANAL
jgi:hypothetical protein